MHVSDLEPFIHFILTLCRSCRMWLVYVFSFNDQYMMAVKSRSNRLAKCICNNEGVMYVQSAGTPTQYQRMPTYSNHHGHSNIQGHPRTKHLANIHYRWFRLETTEEKETIDKAGKVMMEIIQIIMIIERRDKMNETNMVKN